MNNFWDNLNASRTEGHEVSFQPEIPGQLASMETSPVITTIL